MPAQAEELPSLVAHHGRLDDAGDEGDTFAGPTQEGVRRVALPLPRLQREPGRVERLPQFGGDDLACPSCILTCSGQAGGNGERRHRAVGEEFEDDVLARMELLVGAHDGEQRAAHHRLVGPGVLDQQVHVDVEQAGGVVGAFAVTPDPKKRFRDSTQHVDTSGTVGVPAGGSRSLCCSSCCCCCSCWEFTSAVAAEEPCCGSLSGTESVTVCG